MNMIALKELQIRLSLYSYSSRLVTVRSTCNTREIALGSVIAVLDRMDLMLFVLEVEPGWMDAVIPEDFVKDMLDKLVRMRALATFAFELRSEHILKQLRLSTASAAKFATAIPLMQSLANVFLHFSM